MKVLNKQSILGPVTEETGRETHCRWPAGKKNIQVVNCLWGPLGKELQAVSVN